MELDREQWILKERGEDPVWTVIPAMTQLLSCCVKGNYPLLFSQAVECSWRLIEYTGRRRHLSLKIIQLKETNNISIHSWKWLSYGIHLRLYNQTLKTNTPDSAIYT